MNHHRLSWRIGAFSALVLMTGCAVHLPFNHRVSYNTLREANDPALATVPLNIVFQPPAFVERVDSLHPSGFVGFATKARIPTGEALSSRIIEVLDHTAGVSPSEAPLTIVVRDVITDYAYSANLLNSDLAIDEAHCELELELRFGDVWWVERFEATVSDEHVGAATVAGALEAVWDRIALDVGLSVAQHVGAG